MDKHKSRKSMFKRFFCTVGSVAFVTLFGGLTVEAKEIVVENGNIQEALSQAESESEVLTVIIPAGDYAISGVLYVYSDTIIKADKGATITSTNSTPNQTLLTSLGSVSNVTIQGGTWVSNQWSPLQFVGMSNSVIDDVTVITGATYGGVEYEVEYGINLIESSGITVQNSSLQGGGLCATSSSNLKILDNEIVNAATQGIRIFATGNNLVQGNTVTNSGRTGIQLENDSASVVNDNEIIGSAGAPLDAKGNHGEGLVIEGCDGTKVTGNKISDTHSNKENNGNGIIAARSTNILIDGNEMANSGNHGIQVTYTSRAVIVSNNQVSGSGRMGISISRGSQADLKKNTVLTSKVNGIVFDGSEGSCSGSVDGDTVKNSQGSGQGDAGIWIGNSTVNIKNATVADGAGFGMLITKGSTVTAENNKIYQTSVAPEGFGVIVNDNSTAALNGNSIGNFGRSGIRVQASNVSAERNTITINNQTGYLNNAIDNAGSLMNNTLRNPSITVSSASGQNYFDDVEAGVVINGTLINNVIPQGSGGKFAVEYPAQADISGIVLYVKNTDGNVICVNAPNGFTLDGKQADVPENEIDEENVKAFVTRLYQNTLNRQPDQKGLQMWVDELASGRMTGAQVAQGFFFSDEFLIKELENGAYVDILYQTMFGQAGDNDGRNFWIGEMETGFSRLYIYHGFAESPQFQNLCQEYGIQSGTVDLTEARDLNRNVTQFVSRNYSKALGRTPDAGGLNDWCGWILDKTFPPEAVVDNFIFSDEFEKKDLSNEEFVNVLYATYFNRAADPEGYALWTTMLANGGSRRDVVDGFSGADEFHRLVESFNLPQ